MKIKDMEPELPQVCAFCDKAQNLSDEEHMLCSKKGVVSCGYSCKKFRYDPLKRVPRAPIRTHLDIDEIEDKDGKDTVFNNGEKEEIENIRSIKLPSLDIDD